MDSTLPTLLLKLQSLTTGISQSSPSHWTKDNRYQKATYDAWIRACMDKGTSDPPHIPVWKNVSSRRKFKLLHDPAKRATDYVSAYKEVDVETLIDENEYSVEHVLPKSYAKGKSRSDASGDFNNWVEADRDENSKRGNRPLQLWPDSKGISLTHYRPPENQRARLARKWLFARATYAYENLRPPTDQQLQHMNDIIAYAKTSDPEEYEYEMNEFYKDTEQWSNPLLDRDKKKRDRWYDDIVWRRLAFGLDESSPSSVSKI